MISKVSSDMFPISELRKEFVARIRSTGFFNTNPNVIISFKLFSNIVPKLNKKVSLFYGEIIERALSSISFNTIDGTHRLSEVDYMFVDDYKRCVAVLNNGKDLLLLTSDKDACPIVKYPENFTISTTIMKRHYIENIQDFPYLCQMTKIIDSKVNKRAQLITNIPNISQILASDVWINNNIMNCLAELKNLVTKSSFVIR